MLLHTNLLNRKVMLSDSTSVPEHLRGKPGRIVNVWLDTETGRPHYTITVEDHTEPERELWNDDGLLFKVSK